MIFVDEYDGSDDEDEVPSDGGGSDYEPDEPVGRGGGRGRAKFSKKVLQEDPPPASGIEDCGPFKKVWSYRYLCYNLGKEILCLLCFCRFTQFKKFNLDQHMRNKHQSLYHIDDETKKKILDVVCSS